MPRDAVSRTANVGTVGTNVYIYVYVYIQEYLSSKYICMYIQVIIYILHMYIIKPRSFFV